MLGIIGIILAVALFVFMAIKGYNMVLGAVLASIVMALFNSLPVYEVVMGTYVASEGAAGTGFMAFMAGFIKNYMLLFVLSSLLGRIMADGGAARRIALSAAKLVNNASEANKKFACAALVPVLYFILSYVGISGFVLVFTIMPIAKELFENTNTPWRLYCFGGPQAVGTTMLVGSLQAGNIYAADVCGTSTMAGVAPSLIGIAVWIIATIILLKIMLNKSVAKGEGFLTDGAAIKAAASSAQLPEEKLPNFWFSILPLVLVIVLSAAFKIPVIPALLYSCILAIVLFWKNISKTLKSTLANGITSCFGAVFTVSATFAMGSVIKILPAFAHIMDAFNSLPGLLGGVGLTILSAFVMASASSNIAAFGSTILESMTSAGIENGIAHRLMTINGFSCMGPHNAGIANACAVTKIEYKRCLTVYMLATWIPGACAAIVTVALAALGVF